MRTILASIFLGHLIQVGIFGGIQNQCFHFVLLYHSMLSGSFYDQEIEHGIFSGREGGGGRINFGPRIFWGF